MYFIMKACKMIFIIFTTFWSFIVKLNVFGKLCCNLKIENLNINDINHSLKPSLSIYLSKE